MRRIVLRLWIALCVGAAGGTSANAAVCDTVDSSRAQAGVRERVEKAAAYQELPAERYVSLARAALQKWLSSSRGALEIRSSETFHDLRVPAGDLEVHTRLPLGEIRSHAVVWVDVFVAGRLRISRPVHFRVRRWDRVLVARERVRAKSTADAQKFEPQTVDVAGASGTPITDASLLAGKRLRRELAAGAIVSTHDLEDIPVVRQGERIDVYARVGRVVVRTAATAERDGYAGERILARIRRSGERLNVRVTGDNTAWVGEHGNSTPF